MLRSLHSVLHSNCGYLHMINLVNIPAQVSGGQMHEVPNLTEKLIITEPTRRRRAIEDAATIAHAPVDGPFPYHIDCSNWTQWLIKTKRNNEDMKLGEGGYIGGL